MDTPNNAMIDRITERFRALADATRIRILVRLQRGECTVSALAHELGIGQASASKHLAILRQVGFVQVRRHGTQAFCSILDPSVPQLCQVMCEGVTRHIQDQHASLGPPRTTKATRHRRDP